MMRTLHAKLKLPLKRVELQIDHRGMGYIHNADDDEISAYGSFNLTEEENREFGELIATAVNAHADLMNAAQAAVYALKSYEYGNSSPDLAQGVVVALEAALKLARSET